jgi:hypothetical protein
LRIENHRRSPYVTATEVSRLLVVT